MSDAAMAVRREPEAEPPVGLMPTPWAEPRQRRAVPGPSDRAPHTCDDVRCADVIPEHIIELI